MSFLVTADLTTLAGLYIGAWASGYVSGAMFKYVRQVLEKAGASSGG